MTETVKEVLSVGGRSSIVLVAVVRSLLSLFSQTMRSKNRNAVISIHQIVVVPYLLVALWVHSYIAVHIACPCVSVCLSICKLCPRVCVRVRAWRVFSCLPAGVSVSVCTCMYMEVFDLLPPLLDLECSR